MIVPNAAPARMSEDERHAVSAAVESVLAADRWILGKAVQQFEEQFSHYLGFGSTVGVANGTDALVVAFGALELPVGSRVLVAANEGGYAAVACRLAGLEPVAMDVDELTMLPTSATAEAALRDSVCAIVVTHLHGEATDISELDQWRRAKGIALIEDCAQAAGARTNGNHLGFNADATTFSFYPTKNLAAVGDAGAVVFADATAAARARQLREYGWGERFRAELQGGRNSRLDELHAAVLLARLPYLDARNERRRAISARYRDAAAPLHLHGDAASTVAHHSVILSDQRSGLAAYLEQRGVSTAVHYPHLLQEMPGLGLVAPAATPVASRQRERKLSLPCFPELEESEIAHVVESLEEWHATAAAATAL